MYILYKGEFLYVTNTVTLLQTLLLYAYNSVLNKRIGSLFPITYLKKSRNLAVYFVLFYSSIKKT